MVQRYEYNLLSTKFQQKFAQKKFVNQTFKALPFGKAQTMLVEQIRVFEDVVENELQHESLVVPPAEEALVVLCHLVFVLHRPQSASGWDKITHAEQSSRR